MDRNDREGRSRVCLVVDTAGSRRLALDSLSGLPWVVASKPQPQHKVGKLWLGGINLKITGGVGPAVCC